MSYDNIDQTDITAEIFSKNLQRLVDEQELRDKMDLMFHGSDQMVIDNPFSQMPSYRSRKPNTGFKLGSYRFKSGKK